ncbi:MAG: hypothetical protein OFPII_29750 [Osedax symbiont Rs1]|nr:MAG: hypothetical protein OFPII_29750 [Osedax symbiont Rs1]
MNIKKIAISNLLLLITLAAFTAWYVTDVYSASNKIENLIFILPISLAIFVMCAVEIVKQLLQPVAIVVAADESSNTRSVFIVMGLFAAYVLTLETLGFDLGTALFVGSFLYLQGEKSLVRIVLYSVVFSGVIAVFFANMLPYPMPMTFLATDY